MLTDRLRSARPFPPVVVGFDGFVDQLAAIVDRREGPEAWTPLSHLGDFAALVAAAAQRSACREMVVRREAPGGCAINLGDGLAALGVPVHAFATLGEPVHPAFAPVLARFAAVHPLGAPLGRTIALEFSDGKLLLPCVQSFAKLTPGRMEELLADGAYAAACATAGAIALVDWSLFPHMTAIWRWLGAAIFRHLRHRPPLLVDLVDPAGRSPDELLAALAVLRDLEGPVAVHLSCNRNEARQVGVVLGLQPRGDDGPGLGEDADLLRRALGVSAVVIHAHRHTAVADATGVAVRSAAHVPRPAISTGAGDRFNSGYVLGLLLGADGIGRLACGQALAGIYVRTARSPMVSELIAQLDLPPVSEIT